MKETNPTTVQNPADRDPRSAERGEAEIRLLDDLELMLAGGGDGDVSWPK